MNKVLSITGDGIHWHGWLQPLDGQRVDINQAMRASELLSWAYMNRRASITTAKRLCRHLRAWRASLTEAALMKAEIEAKELERQWAIPFVAQHHEFTVKRKEKAAERSKSSGRFWSRWEPVYRECLASILPGALADAEALKRSVARAVSKAKRAARERVASRPDFIAEWNQYNGHADPPSDEVLRRRFR